MLITPLSNDTVGGHPWFRDHKKQFEQLQALWPWSLSSGAVKSLHHLAHLTNSNVLLLWDSQLCLGINP